MKEELATKYAEEQNSAYTNDYYGFIAGWEAKEEKIQNLINTLEAKKGFGLGGLNCPYFKDQQSQMKNAEKIDEVIEIIKTLL